MRSDQDKIDVKIDVNGREGMFLISRLGKLISGRFYASREDIVEG